MPLIWDVIVVGGGASGLMAAGRAAQRGSRVLLLEKMARVAIKLSLTGKGRCNVTNGGELPDFIASYRHNGKFLHNVFSRYFNHDLIAFFHSHGVPTAEERGRRIFPQSNRAQDVVRALHEYALSRGAAIQIHSPVTEIRVEEGRVVGVRTAQAALAARKVILATGGASYPETGSTGDGYRLAARLGHTIVPVRPALVPLEIEEPLVKGLSGLTLKNVRATIWNCGRKVDEEFGEMLFTHFGVSGPIILTLSGAVTDAMGKGRLALSIDFKPALSPEQVENRLIREFQGQPRKQLIHIFAGLLPKRLIPIFLERVKVSPVIKGAEVRAAERKRLAHGLKNWSLTIRKSRPLAEAIVTAGGVSVKEIHPGTMESKRIQGLFFCGEVIDVDGKTGGYNLQAAFSTGWVAGESAANPS
jgi:predicted Rossmann fold flavoprotein